MQEQTLGLILGLTAPDHKLTIFNRDAQVILSETGHSQRDAVVIFRHRFDIERGVSFRSGFRGTLDQPFKLLKPQQMGMRPKA
jgi:hypothetical protein